jgi:hypothetical protein
VLARPDPDLLASLARQSVVQTQSRRQREQQQEQQQGVSFEFSPGVSSMVELD